MMIICGGLSLQGYTPLHIAAMFNKADVFDLLVHYGETELCY